MIARLFSNSVGHFGQRGKPYHVGRFVPLH